MSAVELVQSTQALPQTHADGAAYGRPAHARQKRTSPPDDGPARFFQAHGNPRAAKLFVARERKAAHKLALQQHEHQQRRQRRDHGSRHHHAVVGLCPYRKGVDHAHLD